MVSLEWGRPFGECYVAEVCLNCCEILSFTEVSLEAGGWLTAVDRLGGRQQMQGFLG